MRHLSLLLLNPDLADPPPVTPRFDRAHHQGKSSLQQASKHTILTRCWRAQVKGTTKFAKIYQVRPPLLPSRRRPPGSVNSKPTLIPQAVAQQTGKDKGSFTLTHEGRRVGENETPADVSWSSPCPPLFPIPSAHTLDNR